MHWDPSISVGNLLTIAAMVSSILIGGYKIALHLERSSAAMNNLAAITERLQKAVELQDSRIMTLEKSDAVDAEVRRRMGA